MYVPMTCLDESLRHFGEWFREQFPKPQYQYFVTVLLELMECERRRTLSGLLREVGEHPSLAGLSRFLSEAPWHEKHLVDQWLMHFRQEMEPLVEAEQQR